MTSFATGPILYKSYNYQSHTNLRVVLYGMSFLFLDNVTKAIWKERKEGEMRERERESRKEGNAKPSGACP